MTSTTRQLRTVLHDSEQRRCRSERRRQVRASVRHLLVRLCVGGVGLGVVSTTASAHEYGHSAGYGGAAASFVVVLGLPIFAGLAGGIAAVRYRRLRESVITDGGSSIVVGLLLVGLGAASLLSAVIGHLWLSVAGGIIGVVLALWFVGSRAVSEFGCGNHAEITFGVISIHRLFEGVVLGTLYSTGAAVGLLGAVVLAGHTALETAAVGGLFATIPGRTRAAGTIALVQVVYIIGAVIGLGVASTVPVSIRTLVLAVVGGALLTVGASETERSVIADGLALIG